MFLALFSRAGVLVSGSASGQDANMSSRIRTNLDHPHGTIDQIQDFGCTLSARGMKNSEYCEFVIQWDVVLTEGNGVSICGQKSHLASPLAATLGAIMF